VAGIRLDVVRDVGGIHMTSTGRLAPLRIGLLSLSVLCSVGPAGAGMIGIEWGYTESHVHRIDPATGDGTYLGPVGFANSAAEHEGVIYTLGNETAWGQVRVVTVDPVTGVGTPTVPVTLKGIGGLTCKHYALAASPDGFLYASIGMSPIGNGTGKIDPATGLATKVSDVAGMAFDAAGTLYTVKGRGLGVPPFAVPRSMSIPEAPCVFDRTLGSRRPAGASGSSHQRMVSSED
jgi:hypothetical protein